MASSRNSRSPDLPDALIAALRAACVRRGLSGMRVVAGLSGGRDSVALLHGLVTLRGELDIALAAHHVHHGLSVNADAWAAFCADLCNRLGVVFSCERVAVVRDSGEGIEAAARAARHASLVACDADWIALAHHRGDQAETVLHNLLRGAGVRGLAGMPAARPAAGGRARLIRPLLDVPRSVIDAYLARHALDWIEDESNRDSGYTRNWLRNAVMPLLAQRYPQADAAFARSAAQAAEAQQLLDALAAIDHAACAPGGRVRLDALRTLDAARARNLLRHLLHEAGERMPDAARLSELQRQLAVLSSDSDFVCALNAIELRTYGGELHVLKRAHGPQPELHGVLRVPWSGEAHLDWPGGRVAFEKSAGCGFAADRIAGHACHLATRRGGEHLQPDARRPRRSLKHWFQDLGVPPWERERLPVLWCGDDVVWVPGIGIDVAYRCGEGEAGWMPAWHSRC
jgi:tRNA(Ile)-lysidine synthase